MRKQTKQKSESPPLSEQLRRIIRDAPVSRYQISKNTGVAASTLSKFLSGERAGMTLQSIDQIGRYLRLTLTSAGPVEGE